jgi:hypothetical protein
LHKNEQRSKLSLNCKRYSLRKVYNILYMHSGYEALEQDVCAIVCVCLCVSTITHKLSNVLVRNFVGLTDIAQGQID